MEAPKNLVVRMPNWLGDLVMATPILVDLRKLLPEAKITAMCVDKIAGVLEHSPDIDELFVFSKPSRWSRREQERDIVKRLSKGSYDCGILTTNSFSSAWSFWKAGVKCRIGYGGSFRSNLLNHPLERHEKFDERHLVNHYKELLVPLGWQGSETKPRLACSKTELETARQELARAGVLKGNKIIGINPAAAFGPAKCWLPERFAEVCRLFLKDENIRVVFFGDPKGASLVKEICQGLPDHVINFAGQTSIREFMALLSCCDVLLTNDSGPMHMAAALGTELVALFGSTSDVVTGPYKHGTVIHKHVTCSPCYRRECPVDFRCMTQITVDEVYQAVRAYLRPDSTGN